MSIFTTIFFLVITLLLGFSVAPTLWRVMPIDIFIISLFALMLWRGERRAIGAAIALGFGADLYSAMPFGTFTIILPLLLFFWHVFGYYLFTNRSWWAEAALASLGALVAHAVSWVVMLIAAALSREGSIPPPGWTQLVSDLLRSMILVGIIGSSFAFMIRRVQVAYAQKFLSRRYDVSR